MRHGHIVSQDIENPAHSARLKDLCLGGLAAIIEPWQSPELPVEEHVFKRQKVLKTSGTCLT